MNIGFVGLGTMGLPIAVNIIRKSGYKAYGFDVLNRQCDRFAEAGGTVCSVEDVYKNSDIVFLSLPSNRLVSENLLLAVKNCKPGTVVVDLSSSYPAVIQAVAAEAEKAGIELMDCPISGGEPGAIAGTLAAMCGGEDTVIEKVRPLLEMFCTTVTHMGPLGCGYTAKLANNMIVGVEIAAIAEAFAFAEKAGLNKQKLFDAIHKGGAGSNVLEIKGPKMILHDYEPSSKLLIHMKDQQNALLMGKEIGAAMPVTGLVTEIMEKLASVGRQDEDVVNVLDYFEAEAQGV